MADDDPEQVIDRMERLFADAAERSGETTPLVDTDPTALKHREAISRGAQRDE